MQNFRDFFQKQQFLFPDSRLSHRWSMETFKKNAETKLLFHDALQKYRRDWIRFDQNEKNSTYKALAVSFKKKIKTFYHISRLYPHFPGMENYWANFKTFSRIQDPLRTLELSDCVLCIPFIRSERPIEWLNTYQACAKATWRLGLRLFWSPAITIKIYLQIIFICCVSKTVRKMKVKIVP